MKNEWKVREPERDKKEIKEFARELGITSAFARILMLRGIYTKKDYEAFTNDCGAHEDPFSLPDMTQAAKRIIKAVNNSEKILIYGDYDADGVSAVALLYLYLKSLGADPCYYIPSRLTEGYGVSNAAIATASENGVTLMITVDTGITATSEIAGAKALGIETVVTDHHEVQLPLPDCAANVDLKRPGFTSNCEYAGVGVVLKLVEAIDILLGKSGEDICERFSDIACLGTVADVMSLRGENRTIVKKGLSKINSGNCRPGIKALLENSGKLKDNLTSRGIGYILAPRINAAGRMDSAETALKLLICDDEAECAEIAGELCRLNTSRQNEENTIAAKALEMLSSPEYKDDNIIVLGDKGWHSGIIGIVCSRISEKFGKPVILFSYGDDSVAKGSCRSTGAFNIVKAIESCSELVTRFGGHDMAAGLSLPVENVDLFRRAVNAYSKGHENEFLRHDVGIDLMITSRDLTLSFASELKLLEPCGRDNQEPIFLINNCKVMSALPLSGGKHTKMILKQDGICFECIAFSFNAAIEGILPGDDISLIFTLEAKEYMGRKSVQLFLKDFCFEGRFAEWYECGSIAYTNFEKGTQNDIPLPGRDDFARVYNALRSLCANDGTDLGYKQISMNSGVTSYAATRLIMDIFREAGLVKITNEKASGGTVSLVKTKPGTRADIESTKTYKMLNACHTN